VKNQLDWILDLELVDQSYLDKQIEMFAWTRELKDGRIPRPIKNYMGFGSWKAEGLQKFSFPMADCIFGNCLDDPKEMEIQSLVSRLTELHFYSGQNGWTNEIIEFHRKLAWRLNIYKLKKSKVYKCVPYLFTTCCTFMRIL
jgi:hypothetical protein